MQLENVHVVQFFLYEKQTFDLGHMTGLFGQNGSGKSALLDAVQIALFGANSKLVALNAKADDGKGKKRSIRAYCLGQHGEKATDRARDRACTYITLVWRDSATSRQVSTGVCIEAFADDPQHYVRGTYVADGVALTLGDHLERVEGEDRPREWHAFREDLKRRTAAVSEHRDEVIYETSERYLSAALTRLSNAKDFQSMSLFRRALRFGLRLRFDQAVDETLRHEVMEDRPTNVDDFRVLVEQFRRMREQFDEAQRKLDEARGVEEKYRQAEQAYRRAQSWKLIGFDLDNDAVQSELGRARDELERAEDALDVARTDLEVRRDALSTREAEHRACQMQMTGHAEHGKNAALTVVLTRHREAEEAERKRLHGQIMELRAALLLAADRPEIADRAAALGAHAEALTEHARLDNEGLRGAVSAAVQGCKHALNAMLPHVSAATKEVERIRGEIAQTERDLKDAKAGKARLPEPVRNLRTYLENHGIVTRPVCEGASVRDKDWRQAVEGLLGKTLLQALIVEAHDEKQAYELQRKAPDNCWGKLILTSWIDTRFTPAPGTVAALIEGPDPVAAACLRAARRGVECAYSYEEVCRSRNALTPEGMFASGGGIERRRLPREDELLLGAAQGEAAEALAGRLRRLQHELAQWEGRLNPLKSVTGTLWQVPDFQKVWDGIAAARGAAAAAASDAQATEATLKGHAESDYYEIVKKVEQSERDRDAARSAAASADRLVAQREAERRAAQTNLDRLEEDASKTFVRMKAAYAEAVYDEDYQAGRWESLQREHNGDYDCMREVCNQRIKEQESEQASRERRAGDAASVFTQSFGEHSPSALEGGWRTALPWIQEIVHRLADIDLPQFRDDLIEAEKAAEESFRTDVATKLRENVNLLDKHQQRLNTALRRCPAFSNGERYLFIRAIRPQYQLLYDFVESVAQQGAKKNLFGDPGQLPAEFKVLLDEKAAIGGGNVRTPLDDYREFFEFDVDIMRESADGGSAKRVGSLSKRIGPGSGGEHMAPLYVIAGAALASAYNLDSATEAGMHLILIDEAFDKMDGRNVAATMEFFEQLGLQILLACPIEKRPTLTAFIDRYYTIVRNVDDETVHVERTDVPAATRALARSDLIEYHPELLAAEIERVRAERPANPT